MTFFLVLAFGLPFLAISDLFPFHRYGMFARMPAKTKAESRFSIDYKKLGEYHSVQSGNGYVDNNYLPLWAEKAASDSAFAQKIKRELSKRDSTLSDSLFIRIETENSITRKPLGATNE